LLQQLKIQKIIKLNHYNNLEKKVTNAIGIEIIDIANKNGQGLKVTICQK